MTDSSSRLKKQDSLSLPPTPSAGVARLTMQESVYAQLVPPQRVRPDAPTS